MIESAWGYHEETSYDRYDLKGHYLDWGSQPSVFKVYPSLKTVQLPREITWPELKLSDLLGQGPELGPKARLNVDRLARILALTHSLTATIRQGGGEFYFRSIASAGALYPFELYVAAANSDGLEDGLYHHNVAQQGLTLLRSGSVVDVFGRDLAIAGESRPVLVFFLTSIFYRSSWKYRSRAFRYHLLDTGHMAENLALALKSEGLRFKVCYDFDDERVNGLLGLDSSREVCLAVVPVWGSVPDESETKTPAGPVGDLAHASQVATREVDYPMIREVHRATLKPTRLPSQVPDMMHSLGLELEVEISMAGPQPWPEIVNYVESVMKRRSMRNFVRNELPANAMEAFITALCSGQLNRVDGETVGEQALVVGFLAGKVEGLAPGFCLLNRQNRSIWRVSRGHFMEDMAYACLNQSWLGNCAVHFLFLTNLAVMERTWGSRAYRHVLLSAGRLGQRLYLAATSMRLGCCGIGAYYDNETVRVLALNQESRLLYLVAGGPVRKYTVM